MKHTSQQVDTLIHAGWIIPVAPQGLVLKDHSLAITDGLISALLPTDQATALRATDEYVLSDHALIPGLINAHGHAAMTLLRGYADDVALTPWLQNYIWPVEGRHMGEDFVRSGTELAIAEMLRCGTTCFSDMYFFPDVVAGLCQKLGVRSQLSFPVLDFPSAWGNDADDYIAKGLALRDNFKHSELVTVVFGPHAAYTVNEENLTKVSILAAELDLPVQIHLHETANEVDRFVSQHGERPIERLNRIGLLGPKTQCVHMTAIIDSDIELLSSNRASVIHCPQSNMKLASGRCPVDRLISAGITVGLGTDGAASNNDLNLFGEMQTAALLAKLSTADATVLTADRALHMATLGSAQALGIDHLVGSLEPGKAGDVVAVDMSSIEMQPIYNPVSQLVYAANGSQVTDVWVAGARLMAQRELLRMDLNRLREQTQQWQHRISTQEPTSP